MSTQNRYANPVTRSTPSGQSSLFGTLFDDPPPSRQVFNGQVPTHSNPRPAEARAAQRMAGRAATLRMEVLALIREAPDGLTNQALGRWYAAKCGKAADDAGCRYSVSPRCTELFQSGFIADSGRMRDGFTIWLATAKEGDGRVCERKKGGSTL